MTCLSDMLTSKPTPELTGIKHTTTRRIVVVNYLDSYFYSGKSTDNLQDLVTGTRSYLTDNWSQHESF